MTPTLELVRQDPALSGQVVNGVALAELADTIRREHQLALDAGGEMLTHAIACGEALLAAKAVVPFGAWRLWLQDNTAQSEATSSCYMRLAHYRALVLADGEGGIKRGLRVLRGVDRVDASLTDQRSVEARQLAADGLSVQAIGELLGVSHTTARAMIDHEYRERRKRQSREYQRRRAADRKAKQAQERDLAIKRALVKVGQATSEAYALANRLDHLLGQARGEVQSKDARRAINEAHAHRDEMMAALVRALGVS